MSKRNLLALKRSPSGKQQATPTKTGNDIAHEISHTLYSLIYLLTKQNQAASVTYGYRLIAINGIVGIPHATIHILDGQESKYHFSSSRTILPTYIPDFPFWSTGTSRPSRSLTYSSSVK